jgi:hypothetical protein
MTTIINLCAWIALYFVPTEYNYLLAFCVLAAFSLAFNDVLSKRIIFLFLYKIDEIKNKSNLIGRNTNLHSDHILKIKPT